MQCSHLISKPVPADQIIVSPSSNTPASLSTLLSSIGAGTHAVTKIQSGITGTVISALSSPPIIPAMPLDEDPSKPCRHSLKCLECNKVFQDETSLTTHFQQAADTSGQKTCTVCPPVQLRFSPEKQSAQISLHLPQVRGHLQVHSLPDPHHQELSALHVESGFPMCTLQCCVLWCGLTEVSHSRFSLWSLLQVSYLSNGI